MKYLKQKNYYQEIKFLTSVFDITKFPNDFGVEVAFLGRSNSGKSSAINALANRKLAKISKVPGKTRLINFFNLSNEVKLIDFPGYGYAKLSKFTCLKWKKITAKYLYHRQSLRAVVIFMDARFPFQASDIEFFKNLKGLKISVLILLSKVDKITRMKKKNLCFML